MIPLSFRWLEPTELLPVWWVIRECRQVNPLVLLVLLELARSRNKIPLPKSIAPPGSIPLPPEQDTLLSENYQLLPTLKPPTQTEEAKDDNEGADAVPANPSPNYSQDQRGSEQHQSQSQSQRVSFQLNAVAAAAAKRPLVTIDQLNMG
ncbi:hypothetical protein VPH35_061845 [Triticum aestivum]